MLSADFIRDTLKNHGSLLAQCEVKNLWVFGSVARGDSAARDLDVLVEFNRPPRLTNFMDVKFFLEDLFGVRVDLHSLGACPKRFYRRIEDELQHVA